MQCAALLVLVTVHLRHLQPCLDSVCTMAESPTQASGSKEIKSHRGQKNTSKVFDNLPERAQAVATEANNAPLPDMKQTLKHTTMLADVLRNLIKGKEAAKRTKEDSVEENSKRQKVVERVGSP